MTKEFVIAGIVILFFSCNTSTSSKDSVEKADSANKAKIVDTGKVTDEASAIKTGDEDAAFMVKVADGSLMEVELGRMAVNKSKNKRVKNFGQMMVNDHSKATDNLKNIASKLNVTLPEGVDDKKTKAINDLSAKKDTTFDKDYIRMMVEDHQEDIEEFEKARDKVKDSAVLAFIQKTLPVLRKHLDSCMAIEKAVSKTNISGSMDKKVYP